MDEGNHYEITDYRGPTMKVLRQILVHARNGELITITEEQHRDTVTLQAAPADRNQHPAGTP